MDLLSEEFQNFSLTVDTIYVCNIFRIQIYQKCIKNREKSIVVNCACVSNEYKEDFVTRPPYQRKAVWNKKKKQALHHEYIFEKPEESVQKLAVYPLTKVILVNKDSKIVNGHANMYANGFEEEVLALLNH